ncbi:MAG: hypothetical protein KatS3mg077_1160 [Candidatus Binatia bacterium]|nr:MAG: hypothetical protein KatS3mg077_1160 [Candidatus Binatia bacterium]
MGVAASWTAWIPSTLCALEAKRSIEQLFELLPDCSNDVGLECALAEPGILHGVGLAITQKDPATRNLLPTTADLRLHRLAIRSATWRRLSAWILLWLFGNSRALRQRVPFLFLEFDPGANWENAPAIFVALDWPLEELHPELRQQAPFAVPGFQLILQVLALLGRRARGAEPHQLARCWQALPEGGAWAHVGVFSSRPRAGPRISMLVPRAGVAEYLSRIAPGVDGAALEATIERFAAHCQSDHPNQRVPIDLDVGENVAPRIGIALLPTRPEGWSGLFDALVQAGLCHRLCAGAALAWKDQGTVATTTGRFLSPYLSHVKLVIEGASKPIGSKLYFGIRNRAAL